MQESAWDDIVSSRVELFFSKIIVSTHPIYLRQQSHTPALNPQMTVRGIPSTDVLQLGICGPIANRPFVLLLHYILKSGFRDPIFDVTLDVHGLSTLLAAQDGESSTYVVGASWRDGVVVGLHEGHCFGMFEIAAWGKVATGREVRFWVCGRVKGGKLGFE